MTARVLVILLALAGTASADRSWSRTDSAFQGVFAGSLVADYIQTRAIIARGDEQNPIMGTHGQHVHPSLYFPAAFVLHTVAMRVLPKPLRRVAQLASIGVQIWTVQDNHRAGYTFSYSINY